LTEGYGDPVRHNFVNDIGDYAKYALLRALCASDQELIRLGVIWYLTDHAELNGDGRKRAHLSDGGWERLDSGLLAMMRQLESTLPSQDLSLSLIEASGILPAGTAFFSETVPRMQARPRQRAPERAAWFERARAAVANCNLVFLDPDNGLEVPSVAVTSPLACKYAAVREVAALLDNGASVVLYQHGSRTPWEAQRERIRAQISSGTDRPLVIRTLRFGAFGVRAFFCITTFPRMTDAVEHGLDQLRRRVEGWDKSRYLLIE
jgi:hypothetical protein